MAALSLNPGWTWGDISGIAQGGLLQHGLCVGKQLCHALQKEQGALDLSGCEARRDEICLSPKSGRIVSHPLLNTTLCHLSESGSNTELCVRGALSGQARLLNSLDRTTGLDSSDSEQTTGEGQSHPQFPLVLLDSRRTV